MTNREALNVINSLMSQFKRLEQPTTVEGLKVAKDAIKKQMAIGYKPMGSILAECPVCNTVGVRHKYCFKCGQRLDWDEEKGEN